MILKNLQIGDRFICDKNFFIVQERFLQNSLIISDMDKEIEQILPDGKILNGPELYRGTHTTLNVGINLIIVDLPKMLLVGRKTKFITFMDPGKNYYSSTWKTLKNHCKKRS